MADSQKDSFGKVYLVGAGPGDPGLLTLRGQACLQLADVVIYDYLVNPKILNHCPQAEALCLGKHGGGRIISQEEVNERIVHWAGQGKQVVRLKGGDPAIFARAHEELAVIEQQGIPYEIVPGITSALAVTSSVGVPLTHREHSSAVALVTGQGKNGGPPQNIDYRALAAFPGTLVFYMATTTVDHWSGELLRAGMDGSTPVVAVRHCSLPTQFSFSCRLDRISEVTRQNGKLRPPVLFIVGRTAGSYGRYNWFESRPLFGETILVTRPAHQAESLASRLEQLGAEVLLQPAIDIRPVSNEGSLASAVSELDQFDWIVFSSVNGVEYFFRQVMSTADIRLLGNVKFAVIGPATAGRLADFHLRADWMPERYDADALANELLPMVESKRVLLVRASRGREVLFETLRSVASRVEQVVCYESHDVSEADPEISRRLESGEIDYVTVTSSAIANSLFRLFGNQLRKTALASISPITTSAVNGCDLEIACEAAEATMEGVVEAIVAHRLKSRQQ